MKRIIFFARYFERGGHPQPATGSNFGGRGEEEPINVLEREMLF